MDNILQDILWMKKLIYFYFEGNLFLRRNVVFQMICQRQSDATQSMGIVQPTMNGATLDQTPASYKAGSFPHRERQIWLNHYPGISLVFHYITLLSLLSSFSPLSQLILLRYVLRFLRRYRKRIPSSSIISLSSTVLLFIIILVP